MFNLLTTSSKNKNSSRADKKAKDSIKQKADQFSRMRKDAGYDQDQLAMLLYKDPGKRQRVGKIERGEVQPTFFEGLSWLKHCSVGVDQENVVKAIEMLEQVSIKK